VTKFARPDLIAGVPADRIPETARILNHPAAMLADDAMLPNAKADRLSVVVIADGGDPCGMGLFRRTPSLAEADRFFDQGVAAMRGGDLRRSLSALLKAHELYAALGPDEAARRGAARTLWRQANAYAGLGAGPNALAAGLDAAMIWSGCWRARAPATPA
jgi:hypothetical protein